MSVADFLGRTSDVLAFHGDFPSDRELLTQQTLVPEGTGGLLCTGVQKIAQRFLLILLTKKGTLLYRVTDGTTFMIDAERGAWRTTLDVQQSFTLAKLDFMRQLRALELPSDPPDEIVDEITLTNVTLLPDRVGLTIRLTTQAGSDYTFITPIAVPLK
jgi:hypothetical protein